MTIDLEAIRARDTMFAHVPVERLVTQSKADRRALLAAYDALAAENALLREERDRAVNQVAAYAAENAALRSRLAEAEALLLETIPAVQSYARKHSRAVVAAARRNDADHVAKHAEFEKSAWRLTDKIRAFLTPDSAP